jgi:galactitol-specific phosphotransferase system IIC component
MSKQIILGVVAIVALMLLSTVIIGLFSSLQASSQQQVSSKSSSMVEMLQGNGTYWIFYGGNIYQSNNASLLLQLAQNYYSGTPQP